MVTEPETSAPAPFSARRRAVAQAIAAWKRQLVDLGGRNNLLYYRDLRAGTLDLTGRLSADEGERLLSGAAVRLSHLFAEPDALRDAARRARTMRAKAIENDEERGLKTLYLGYGLATWQTDRTQSTPSAPVLLYPLQLTTIGVSGEDFRVEVVAEPQVNPTLLYLLETDFGVRLPAASVLDPAAPDSSPDAVVEQLMAACESVQGFRVTPRVVAGNFSYAKLPMVADMERAEEEIAAHSLLSAIAGDLEAKEEVRERHRTAEELNLPAVPPPADEFLILDADSSQSRVIAAARAGSDVVVIGPPGTGKSQTIANLIATMIARGQSVLFVAEKRAAIDAVTNRLNRRELGDLVLDLHDGASNRRRLAEELERALAASHAALEPDVSRLHAQLERRRGEIEAYADQLHQRIEPWGISAYEAQQRILGIPQRSHTAVRLRGAALQALLPPRVTELCEDAASFVERGGPALLQPDHPWSRAYTARTATEPALVETVLSEIYETQTDLLPRLEGLVERLAHRCGLREPQSLDEAAGLLDLLRDTAQVQAMFTDDVFSLAMPDLLAALAPLQRGGAGRLFASVFNGRYKQARATLRSAARDAKTPDAELLRGAGLALHVSEAWNALSSNATSPAAPEGWAALEETFEAASTAIGSLTLATGGYVDYTAPFPLLHSCLQALSGQQNAFMRFPQLITLEGGLREARLWPVMEAAMQAGLSGREASQAVEHAWLASILDHLYVEQPALASFTSQAQEAAVQEFARADRAHIEIATRRVRRAWAERAVAARNAYPEEAAQVARQASLRRRHMPLRDLFDQAEHVLTAVKPCWVMSPLVVAQVLPSRQCFDIVVFDEASQILPADAVCSVLRGRRTVVAGDPHQLPPTTFFTSGREEEEGVLDEDAEKDDTEPTEEEAEAETERLAAARRLALTQGQESILDVVRALLPPPQGTRVLSWHYRSRDERLITFSNAQESLYDWSLTTFPGALPGDSISHVLVPFRLGAPQVPASVSDEVDRVVELVREHARLRPGESLGVIALGNAHAVRIAEALRLAAIDEPAIAALLDESLEESLFVKNLERVQGDERDAIILTVGYGKTTDGRMRYNFGPVNQEGGQRRLNVAITRARRRMTVVSSFSGGEMDPERTRSIGARMLRDYLLYAESGGTNLGVRALSKPPLNPFERDIEAHLQSRGVRLVPQFGASGYWIDFAAMHPERPGEPVLAIEADGPLYHSSASARDRDRLRQEHLERLGWRFHRIWSTDWFRSREAEFDKALRAYQRAVESVSNEPEPTAPPPAPAAEEPDWLPEAPQENGSVRGPKPNVRPGYSIADYTHAQLVSLVRWVKSDGRLYTEEQLLREVMDALGFGRRGTRIVDAITRAIHADRA